MLVNDSDVLIEYLDEDTEDTNDEHSEIDEDNYDVRIDQIRKKQKLIIKCSSCGRNVRKLELETHLQNQDCLRRFMEELKVKSISAVLVQSFLCPFCCVPGTFSLKNHLQCSVGCFEGFSRILEVDDIG